MKKMITHNGDNYIYNEHYNIKRL